MKSQDQIFVDSEADRWFERNRAAIERLDLEADLPLRLMTLYALEPRAVLEIGAANGYRVAEVARRTGARAVAVEPSELAIADGRARHPSVEFHRGEARALPVDGPFDLVILHFVLHWIDRANLLKCVAEVDRVLADGGYLLVGDFHPWLPMKVSYHHLPGASVHTYKQDYAGLFLVTGSYRPVAMLTGLDHQLRADASDDRRSVTWLLHKRVGGGYLAAPYQP